MCVCFLPIHSGHRVRWTYQPGRHTGFLIHLPSAVRALIFLARRIQPFLSLVDPDVELCVLTILSFSTHWAFLLLLFSVQFLHCISIVILKVFNSYNIDIISVQFPHYASILKVFNYYTINIRSVQLIHLSIFIVFNYYTTISINSDQY